MARKIFQGTEDQIEAVVASKVDRLDRDYLNGAMTEAEYRATLIAIDKWAEWECRFATREVR